MDGMLEGIEVARAAMDDILVAGRDEEEHDCIPEKVIRRATDYNLGFNFKKAR